MNNHHVTLLNTVVKLLVQYILYHNHIIACFNLCISVLSGLSVCVCVCVFMVFPCLLFICQFVCLDWRNKDIYYLYQLLRAVNNRSNITKAEKAKKKFKKRSIKTVTVKWLWGG